jgi:FtsH-binding integral membrane protein
MALGQENRWSVRGAAAPQALVDVGLREYLLRVYNYMASGLALTGIVAYLAYGTGFYESIRGTPLLWVVALAPLGAVMFMSFRIETMRFASAQIAFWVFAALMGLSLASIFFAFTHESIAKVFFITAGTFAAMSLYGYTTKTDLSRFGSFLLMGLIGIILASLVNVFFQSPALHFAVSVIGVLVFVGLTAYDTQRIKEMYWAYDDGEIAGKKAIMGALQLYLDFINLFMLLLQFFGTRRD